MADTEILRVGLAQISPVWLNMEKTREKIIEYIGKAGREDCDLVVFSEALLPGYPFWLGLTDGAAGSDINRILEERQNLDINGHYSRPDVLQLTVNRVRQSNLRITE